MSSAGLERVRRNFSWPKKAAQIVAIYRDLLGLSCGRAQALLHDVQTGQEPMARGTLGKHSRRGAITTSEINPT